MKEDNIESIAGKTGRLLGSGRYKDCFDLLRSHLGVVAVSGGLARVNQAESTYRYLLRYFQSGAEDPGRDKVLADIRSELQNLAALILRESEVADSSRIFYSTLRMMRLRPCDIPATVESVVSRRTMTELALSAGSYPLSEIAAVEEDEGRLFDSFWVADDVPDGVYREVGAAIASGKIPSGLASLILSAAGLGVLATYSHMALMMMCDAVSNSDPQVAARAAVSLVMALDRWRERVADDWRLLQRLESLVEEDGVRARLRAVVFALVKTRDTDRVSKKMRNDLIPGLMQFGPDIIKRLKEASKESSFADIESNPEWERLLGDTGLEEKLRELTEMQSDGADVMMAAFSNLKSFPFFRQLRNWMLPFSTHHTMLAPIRDIDSGSISDMLELNGMMCDSDKYSFAFSLSAMPDAQRRMVMGQMQAQMDQVREQMRDLQSLRAGHEFEDETLRYCRDLYRFYNLFVKRAEFYNPFAGFVRFQDIPVLSAILDSQEDIQAVAEFYFKRGYYREAYPLLADMASRRADLPHVWEKIGFCCEKTGGDPHDAVEAYMKAQLFNPDSRWISRRLGLCCRRLGDFSNAVDYLRMSLPEDGGFDRRMALMIADTLMDAERWDEALLELHRVDYESPGDAEVIRRMALCAFRSGDLDKARGWLGSIAGIDLNESDHRLMGHVCLAARDIPGAMASYRKTIRPNDSEGAWKRDIMADAGWLGKAGVSRRDMDLLLDSIAYGPE